jgi:hypothetical protein
MWLVLCSRADVSALWAHEGLKQRAVAPLELVLSEELAGATLIEHRLDANGAQIKIGLTDGRVLSSRKIRGTLNRLIAPSPDLIRHAVATDLEYAQAGSVWGLAPPVRMGVSCRRCRFFGQTVSAMRRRNNQSLSGGFGSLDDANKCDCTR